MYNNRGCCYYQKWDYDKAIADLTKAIEINPKDDDSYNRRGIYYMRKGDSNKGIADFTKAAQLGNKAAQYTLRSKGISW